MPNISSLISKHILLLLSLLQLTIQADVCRALVMSGGGSKGAYEAGVINGLVNLLDPEDVQYDVVSGVSAGALNAAFVSLFAKGDEQKMTEAQLSLYYNMSNSMVWKEWDDGLIAGIFNHSGFLD